MFDSLILTKNLCRTVSSPKSEPLFLSFQLFMLILEILHLLFHYSDPSRSPCLRKHVVMQYLCFLLSDDYTYVQDLQLQTHTLLQVYRVSRLYRGEVNSLFPTEYPFISKACQYFRGFMYVFTSLTQIHMQVLKENIFYRNTHICNAHITLTHIHRQGSP